jgi:hypothetical protein
MIKKQRVYCGFYTYTSLLFCHTIIRFSMRLLGDQFERKNEAKCCMCVYKNPLILSCIRLYFASCWTAEASAGVGDTVYTVVGAAQGNIPLAGRFCRKCHRINK